MKAKKVFELLKANGWQIEGEVVWHPNKPNLEYAIPWHDEEILTDLDLEWVAGWSGLRL